MLPVITDPEAHLDDLLFLGGERLENLAGLVPKGRVDDRLDRRLDLLVLNQVAESGLAVPAYRRLKRDRISGNALELLNLLGRDLHALSYLVIRRSAP